MCVSFLAFASLLEGCSSRQTVVLDLSGLESTPLPPVNGVNTNFFFAPEKVTNETVWQNVEEANFPVLRFPGGRGNFYDWRTGTADIEGRDEANTVAMRNFMVRARDADTSVSFVVDVTDSPASIRDLARTWRRTGAPVRYVELGNEYYLPKLVGSIGGPSGYLKRARVTLDALRAGGYRGPVGLVAAPEEDSSQSAAEGWNQKLSEAETSEFDAVILHHYPSLSQTDLEEVYERGPVRLTESVEGLRKLFPGKRVWVTEWSLGQPANAPEFNTLGHALFDLRMLEALADARVSMADYHVLTGLGWELLGPNRFALDYSGNDARLIRRVPYFAFEMFGEAASGGAKYMRGTELAGEVEYMAFRTSNELRVVAWTISGGTYRIKVETGGSSTKFTGGKALLGDLDSTNGSVLTMKDTGETWNEEVKPVRLGKPHLKGPGAVLLRFSLDG